LGRSNRLKHNQAPENTREPGNSNLQNYKEFDRSVRRSTSGKAANKTGCFP
jgi:hypothetical protein